MKKKILLFSLIFILNTVLIAQIPVMQRNLILEPYSGFPTGNVAWNNGGSDTKLNYKVNGGQFSYGGRLEYMISNDFGIGVDGNYVKTGFHYDSISYAFNNTTGQFDTITNHYDKTNKRIRLMIRMNKHFYKDDKVDAYYGFGIGYKIATRTPSTNDENSYWIDNQNNTYTQEAAIIPISCRIAVGVRCFFTPNIGFHIELGIGGGGLIQGGLALKF